MEVVTLARQHIIGYLHRRLRSVRGEARSAFGAWIVAVVAVRELDAPQRSCGKKSSNIATNVVWLPATIAINAHLTIEVVGGVVSNSIISVLLAEMKHSTY